MPSSSAISKRCLLSGIKGDPSYKIIVAFDPKAETNQFHIIHPQVVK